MAWFTCKPHIKQEVGNSFDFYDPFREFFSSGRGGQQPKYQPQVASGSGVIISEDGFVVTNNHVVEGAEQVEITLNDNKKYQAKVIGTDPTTDLALLKVDAHGLPYVAYGNSDALKVGEWVLAVGNPFNLNLNRYRRNCERKRQKHQYPTGTIRD
jgi:serine protease Do